MFSNQTVRFFFSSCLFAFIFFNRTKLKLCFVHKEACIRTSTTILQLNDMCRPVPILHNVKISFSESAKINNNKFENVPIPKVYQCFTHISNSRDFQLMQNLHYWRLFGLTTILDALEIMVWKFVCIPPVITNKGTVSAKNLRPPYFV